MGGTNGCRYGSEATRRRSCSTQTLPSIASRSNPDEKPETPKLESTARKQGGEH